MIVGAIVRDTIQLHRAISCEHAWQTHNASESQCRRCGVIATEEGKQRLERMKANEERKWT